MEVSPSANSAFAILMVRIDSTRLLEAESSSGFSRNHNVSRTGGSVSAVATGT